MQPVGYFQYGTLNGSNNNPSALPVSTILSISFLKALSANSLFKI